LDQYQVLDNAGWQALPAVRHLPESEQGRLRDEVSDLLLLLARATGLSGVQPRDPADAGAQLQLALRLNERAAAVASGEKSVEGEVFSTPLSALNAPGVSRALWTQRAELTRLLGRPDEARGLLEQARKTPLRTAKDRYLVATEHAAQGRYREAIPLLQEAVELDPKDFWAWFVLGHCHSGLAQAADAVACYNAAVALWPDYPWAYFNRGLAHLKLQNYRRAAADLDRAVHLKPDAAEPYLNRALARQGLKDYAGTVADLTRVLDLDPSCTRAYFMRARARELAGDAAGAKRDLEQGLSREPADEHGWVARGLARLTTDLAGALGDFDKALEFNPRSLAALQNKAHVLGRLNRTEEAVRVLDRAVELYPDFVPSRAGRGVYHGRLGHRAEALADAKESLLRDTNPSNVYQVAGIYALTSRQEADDRHEAFRLLASALRKGFGFDLLESDPDLNPIRKEPEFRRLVDASRSVSANATPKGP
jgi:tetratricopeptide (TPR) repeat protein